MYGCRTRAASAPAVRVATLVLASLLCLAQPSPGLEPAQGRFLVAERDLRDPNFAETVILLTEYDEAGAMGLIVNWPTAVTWEEFLPELGGLEKRGETLFVGGPVSRRVLLMLLRTDRRLDDAERVGEEVWLSASRELLVRVLAGEEPVDELRLYSGYAGWGPGQLDLELAAGGWRVVAASTEDVFSEAPDELWSRLIVRGEMQWTRRLQPLPSHPR